MRRKGFTFACPSLVSNEEDKPFQRFFEAAKADPDKIYNPLPQIACSDNFNEACTNPLINMCYLPTSDLNIYMASELKQLITTFHEWTHLNNDATPAKLLARLHLNHAYAYLDALLDGESWNSELWRKLREENKKLTAICRAITLSEELLAIAVSFGHMFRCPEYSKAVVELERLEEKSVEEYQKLSRHFGVLYYNGFKKLGGYLYEWKDLSIALAVFLQGVQLDDEYYLEVVDSERRCSILAEKAKDIINGAELANWIAKAVVQNHEFAAYKATLATLVNHRELSENGSSLWTLMKGRKPREGVSDYWKAALRTKLLIFRPNRVKILLRLQESERDWLILPSFLDGYGSHSQIKAAIGLLGIESLRQQLDEGKGIYCPFYKPGICPCPSSCREALMRLLQWAREGKFGDGEWRDLPPECSSGV